MNLHQYLGSAVGALMGGLTFESVISGKSQNLLSHLGQGLVAALIGIPLAYLAIVLLWKRSFDWMRLRFSAPKAIGGFLLGLVQPVTVLVAISAFGDVSITASPSRLTAGESAMILVSALGWMSFIAFSEETVFRGILVREWASRWGWKVATLLGGLVFGAMHLLGVSSGLTLVTVIWILVAGVAVTILFVAFYLRAKSLWLPIGFHAGWNLCLQGVLGITISGKEPDNALYLMNVSGQDWLTGGAFGIEASIVAIAVYVLTAAVVLNFGRSANLKLLNPRPNLISE
jgi:hypothetical protein